MTTVAHVLTLPQGDRARRAYRELRRYGYSGVYAASAVATLESARSNLERWALAQGALNLSPHVAGEWLKAQGYR